MKSSSDSMPLDIQCDIRRFGITNVKLDTVIGIPLVVWFANLDAMNVFQASSVATIVGDRCV